MSKKIFVHLTWQDKHTLKSGDYSGGLPIAIGRNADNDVVFDDGLVSRLHARLEAVQGKVLLVDQGSANGTFVNGQRIQTYAIGDNSQFQIGSRTFRLTIKRQSSSGRHLRTPQSLCSTCQNVIDTKHTICPHCGTFVENAHTVVQI